MINQTGETLNPALQQAIPKVARRVVAAEQIKRWEQALQAAAQIRQQLAGRVYSDSTQFLAEDRQR